MYKLSFALLDEAQKYICKIYILKEDIIIRFMFENSIFFSLEGKKINFLNWDLYYLQNEYFRIIFS